MAQRWSQHVTQSRSTKNGRWHFPNAIRKYGPQAFSHEVLEVCCDLSVANLAEECWIELFDTRNPEKGFNLAKGGQHIPHSIRKNPWDDPEYRERLTLMSRREMGRPEVRAKISLSLKERCQDDSHKSGMSERARKQFAEPGARDAVTTASREMWKDPGFRSRYSTLWSDPEFRSRCTAALKERNEAEASKTHCKHGHEYTEENTYRPKKGGRECRACHNLRNQTRRQARKLAS